MRGYAARWRWCRTVPAVLGLLAFGTAACADQTASRSEFRVKPTERPEISEHIRQTRPRDGAKDRPGLRVAIVSPAEVVYAAPRDGCDPDDIPDAPVRAYRDSAGGIVMFGLHSDNRALRGQSFDKLHIDCHIVYPSHGDPDPAHYDDRSWIAATWSFDGRAVSALIHHEYQANEHPGRCRFPAYLQCWFNTVLETTSSNGGIDFRRPASVVASAPFPQDQDQGRHRGFFNPSNIVADGGHLYFLASTTGWTDGGDQQGGVCLFRSDRPEDPGSWRAWDGQGFTIRYGDPYRVSPHPAPCAVISPFQAPVGSIVRVEPAQVWLAVFQAKADAALFPVSGFYTATSPDLVRWSPPHLLLTGPTLYDDPCSANGALMAYPTILDPATPSRNFDRAGTAPDLYYDVLETEGCSVTSRRSMLRRKLAIGTIQ